MPITTNHLGSAWYKIPFSKHESLTFVVYSYIMPLPAEEKGHLFEKRDIPSVVQQSSISDTATTDEEENDNVDAGKTVKNSKLTKLVSTLSKQLEELETQGSNPFFKYAKFDGRVSLCSQRYAFQSCGKGGDRGMLNISGDIFNFMLFIITSWGNLQHLVFRTEKFEFLHFKTIGWTRKQSLSKYRSLNIYIVQYFLPVFVVSVLDADPCMLFPTLNH